jgi:ABC-type multidrug transport system fused ATPase/permease subunit
MQASASAKLPGIVTTSGPTLMPHRLAMIWNSLAAPAAWVSALSGVVGFITGDGLAAAITVIGLALVVTLNRMTPAIAVAIREWGTAYAEFRGKLRRELADTTAKTEENSRAIEDVRSRAARDVAEAKAEAAREVAAAKEEVGRIERDASLKRHALADRLQGALLAREVELREQRMKVARLEARLGLTTTEHAEAINTISDSVTEIAGQMRPPIPVETPHVDPAPPEANGDAP